MPLAKASRAAFISALAKILRIPAKAFTDATSASGTLLQLFLPAAQSGLDAADPAILARTAFLASVADTLPAHLSDPLLASTLADAASWSSSASTDLADAASVFAILTALPRALTITRTPVWADVVHPPALNLLYNASTASFDLALLPAAAGHHLQSVLTDLVAHTTIDQALDPSSDLDILTRARIRSCTIRGSSSILRIRHLPPTILLTDFEVTFFICHRLGIPLAPHLVATDRLTSCSKSCSTIPPSRPIMNQHHPLYYQLPHAYHHIACGCDSGRIDRHEAIATAMADSAPGTHSRPDISAAPCPPQLQATSSPGPTDCLLQAQARAPPTIHTSHFRSFSTLKAHLPLGWGVHAYLDTPRHALQLPMNIMEVHPAATRSIWGGRPDVA